MFSFNYDKSNVHKDLLLICRYEEWTHTTLGKMCLQITYWRICPTLPPDSMVTNRAETMWNTNQRVRGSLWTHKEPLVAWHSFSISELGLYLKHHVYPNWKCTLMLFNETFLYSAISRIKCSQPLGDEKYIVPQVIFKVLIAVFPLSKNSHSATFNRI